MPVEIVVALKLFFLWCIIGEFGWRFWRKSMLKICKPKLATERMLLNTKILMCKNKFRVAGPFALYVALSYFRKKKE